MPTRPPTLLAEIGRARAECEQLVAEANRFLAETGGESVPVPRPGPVRLALFGQYNAGKSTLVNALLGERRAPTGDAPTTRTAGGYDWRGFHVVDLPGSNARLAEQEEARRALEHAHAVLYVVSAMTGLDYETFWDDLGQLRQAVAPFLLVVNDKQPHPSDESRRAFREQLEDNFRRRRAEKFPGAAEQEPLFWVNARSAERGRLEGKPRLVEASGIEVLENALAEFLFESEEFLRDLDRLDQVLTALRSVQAEQTGKLASAEARALGAALERCDTARERLARSAEVIAHEPFAYLRETLAAQLTRAVDGEARDRTAVTAAIADQINRTFDQALAAFEQYCRAEFAALASLSQRELAGANVLPRGVDVPLGELPEVRPAGPGLIESVLNNLPRITLAGKALAAAAETALGSALGQGGREVVEGSARALTAPGGKEPAGGTGRALASPGPREVVDAAARAGALALGRLVGPVVMVAFAGWELYQGLCRANLERAAREAALREVEARAGLAAAMARQEFLGRASRFVEEALAPFAAALREEIHARARQQAGAEKRLAHASALRERIERAMNELKARTR
jgi:50S ribosome-binding GTPase